VLTALFEVSDHLPVVADFEVSRLGIGVNELRDKAMLQRGMDGRAFLSRIAVLEDWHVETLDAAGRIIESRIWPAGEARWTSSASLRGWLIYRVKTPSGVAKFAAPQ
jgi:hypothetical protein